ncbi:hypothetical protein [Actinomadura alba]|uniref:Uncharacterized protein n=1 Tax=Actinomadura alba TaxID=406431 RepID=A0ABR7M2V3_9ACTN|nr:hypothetical protein [Actinomadura alba]MBC6471027.1 hypothetical protein [Actinomadura alba]
MTIRTRALKSALVAGVAAVAGVVGPAAAAAAHPFGPPSTARISVDGSRVAISWLAAEDDWVALGQSVGAFEDPGTGAVSTDLTGEQKLQRSPAVRDYLLKTITVAQDGRPCEGRLAGLDRLLAEGARLTFDCPAPVVVIDVGVGALTDLNQAYRTMLTSESPATPSRSLFTATQRTQRLRFSGSGGSRAVVTTSVGTAAALCGIGAVALLMRRRARGRR